VDTAGIRGPGIHKHDFTGLRTERFKELYTVHGELGRGSFGRVLAVTQKATGQQAVCKVISKAKFVSQDKNIVRNEIEIVRTLDHPNIIRIFEYFEDAQAFYIIFERIAGADLQEEVSQSTRGLPEAVVARYIRQVLLAINYCHSLPHPVVHRDIKPANVMRLGKGRNYEVKVIDYGLGALQLKDADLKKVCGTPVFMAPEVFQGRYGKEADIWSIGMTTYYLLAKELPFPQSVSKRFQDFRAFLDRWRLSFPSEHGWGSRRMRSARDLIRGMIVHDPMHRLTAAQALRSEFIMRNMPSVGLGWRGHSTKLVGGLSGYALAPPVLRVVLLMAACQVDQAQMGKMKRQFVAIDQDCDGFIALQDLEELLKKRGDSAPATDVLQVVDLDRDGVIGFTEYVAAWLYSRLRNDTSCLRYAFEIFDEDGDGLVSRKDVIRGLNTPQLRMLGGTAALAQELSDIFPSGNLFDFTQFAACLVRHEPVQLGLRFVRPPHRAFCEDHCASWMSGGAPNREAAQNARARVLRFWTNARAKQSAEYQANESDMDDESDTEESPDGGDDTGSSETESSQTPSQRGWFRFWF